jgi:drug/metabolite transporter (DMT)-like permease
MSLRGFVILLTLSAIWGASFLFMRVSSVEFGPIALVMIRMVGAALLLVPIIMGVKARKEILQNLPSLAVVSVFNHLIPFSMLSFATMRLEAGFTSLLNATTPMFTALVGWAAFNSNINRRQVWGLLIAFLGVFILSADKLKFKEGGPGWAIAAGLIATCCYGIAVHYTRRYLSHLTPITITSGSILLSGILCLVPGLWFWPAQMPGLTAWSSALLLAIFCTALAFLLFYKLLSLEGPMISTTVTFLVPVFAIGWGVMLLNETLSARLLVGMAITFVGTAITVNLLPKRFR